ncbi:MAG: DoxX family protein [Gemmataceae bacterium]
MRIAFGLIFVAAGVLHLVRPGVFVKAMPPYLPWPYELVIVSGLFEILGGVLLQVPRTRRAAAWGLVALLVAVFPANVHMALNPEPFPAIPPWALWARLPLQAALIGWAWLYTRPPARAA